MNCPSCGAPIALKPDTEGFKCDYCHAVFHPDAQGDGVLVSSGPDPAGLACPVCSLPLVRASIAKIPVLFCNQCHGFLMAMPVVEAAIDELRGNAGRPAVQTPPDRGDLKRTVQCPKCHRRMDTHFYSGPGNVIVDSCDTCLLIWFDRGELTRIARAPDEKAVENLTWS
jgi:Zn-finger nucleic acid-binding protein